MTCFHPLTAYYSKTLENGKRRLVFSPLQGFVDRSVKVPCGQCIGCRLERSRQWAIRCMHEAQLYDDNSFITLTFDDEHLPYNRSLSVRTFQLFMKRLRKRFGADIRFFHCGEYGENFGRPHYHACLFNFDFSDKVLFRDVRGCKLYTSVALSDLWPFGYSTIGSVTFESAAYVARYIMKKVTGEQAALHYEFVHPATGEIFHRLPEYTTMSRRPGIGSGWYDKFKDDVYPSDFVVVNGQKMRPPKYYDRLFEHEYPSDYVLLKCDRHISSEKYVDNNTPDRLNVRERVQEARLSKLPRILD